MDEIAERIAVQRELIELSVKLIGKCRMYIEVAHTNTPEMTETKARLLDEITSFDSVLRNLFTPAVIRDVDIKRRIETENKERLDGKNN